MATFRPQRNITTQFDYSNIQAKNVRQLHMWYLLVKRICWMFMMPLPIFNRIMKHQFGDFGDTVIDML